MTTLYDLTTDFQQVQSMIEEGNDGLVDTLESINLAIEDKLENIGKVIRNLEGEAAAFKDEEKRLADKRKTIENNIKNLKLYAEQALKATGERKLKTGLFTYSIQKNPPSVNITNQELIPERFYVEVDPKLDKATIKDLLKSGETVPGVELVQGEGLRFK
ncbi:siphovirus Gp157 family protein [Virgibacillus sp. FSP13]